ncbi:hypothetical protein SPRG_21599 [Saprolegnia parasitica CBS 223.65]|uniref:LYC1 C-terminal domain-containing protein n=1 Tax=Saprolegnia parasitica (strain CBS 223.65) TaxID=695850 RepID=A0A067BMD4_SAPPC|nr:hypothetical protein SPRG_21599 [Saprolegnia parasitica CBS 223.65]KDO17900.1 hypothetical protein SPRG_21599 [Saprolegnia parasitica CBS 223.65]|eukprot:XP_012211397.1 hypothetical protein SPRG_21599 [Saprolegnia parasitica CBS 223.65]
MELELRLRSKAQEDRVNILTYSSWGAPHVTFPQYLVREAHFRSTQFGAWMADYVFIPKNDPDTVDIRGYLEIFQRRAVLRPHDGSPAITFDAYSVASALPYLVSNLYSDVGTSFYAKCGWDLVASDEILLPVATTLPEYDASLVLITSLAALEPIAALDRAAMIATLRAGEVGFLLTTDCIEFYHVKHRYCGVHRHQMTTLPTNYGAYLQEKGTIRGYVIWTYNFEERTLDVLKFRALDDATDVFAAFGPTLHAEAAAWGLDHICLWPTRDMALPESIRALARPRDDSLSMLLVQGNHAGPEDDANSAKPFQWVADELYLYA